MCSLGVAEPEGSTNIAVLVLEVQCLYDGFPFGRFSLSLMLTPWGWAVAYCTYLMTEPRRSRLDHAKSAVNKFVYRFLEDDM